MTGPATDTGGLSRYQAICSICGTKGLFEGEPRKYRESFPCTKCRATLRYRNQATAILWEFGGGQHACLAHFAKSDDAKDLRVFEVALRGPLHDQLKHLPKYRRSYYWEGVERGEVKNGVQCQDLEKLTFDDCSFELVVSSDVMEHVANPSKAFAEIWRVLAPGGVSIFSIPLTWPLPLESVQRSTLSDGVLNHHQPPHYHNSGLSEPSLVFTDFGADLVDELDRIGYLTTIVRPALLVDHLYRDAIVCARKPLIHVEGRHE